MSKKIEKKNVPLSFWQIVPENEYMPTTHNGDHVSKATIQRYLRELPNFNFRKYQIKAGIFTLGAPIEVGATGIYKGVIIKTRMNDIPPGFDVNTSRPSPLGLDDSQGLGRATCFIIDTQANILVCEKASTNITAKMICRYLYFSSGAMPRIKPVILVEPASLERFYNLKTIFEFEVGIARQENGTVYNSGEGLSINQIIDSATDTNNDKLSYKISINGDNRKEGKSLRKNKIIQFVENFTGYIDSKEVNKMIVKGVDPEGNISPIDLIENKIFDEIEISIPNRLMHDFNLSERFEKILQKYNHHRQSLLDAYSIRTDEHDE